MFNLRVSTVLSASLLLFSSACSSQEGGEDCSAGKCDEAAPGAIAQEYPLSNPALFPEGGTYDEEGEAFYVGSMALGNVTRVTLDGEETEFFANPNKDAPGDKRATLGMDVDAARRQLWVCSVINGGDNPGTIWRIDLETGELLRRIELSNHIAKASCNDVAVAPDGMVYVTDRENPYIYKINPDTVTEDMVSIFANHKLLQPRLVGLNGIVITPDGSTMIVTKYLPAGLFRISMDDPSVVEEIDRPIFGRVLHVVGSLFSGADGLAFYDGALYLAFGDGLFRLVDTSDINEASWTSAELELLKEVDPRGGLTTLMVAKGRLYGANGQAPTFIQGDSPEPAVIWDLGVGQ